MCISVSFSNKARAILDRMVQTPRFPPMSSLSGHNLTHIGKLLRGMDVQTLSFLNKDSLEDALDDINDLDFDDYQVISYL